MRQEVFVLIIKFEFDLHVCVTRRASLRLFPGDNGRIRKVGREREWESDKNTKTKVNSSRREESSAPYAPQLRIHPRVSHGA